MQIIYSTKHNITSAKAVEILAKHGTKVTLEEAQIILDFMYKFGKLAIETELNALEIKFKKQSKVL
ncbi:hypothetical protein BDD43_4539 [Mucilaginibacter gracilis]|uniref:Uncharacterized protein n=1 Tax=Mucilaginibacter gracilis TaxID=423350 RepID=A0A495J609_9SPHI|nr:hypothetical protein [Mucilaginibacter gracilis]RKR84307.1 hypothetical protein BDD43_4539 [Mucilaginibacter gracilis]